MSCCCSSRGWFIKRPFPSRVWPRPGDQTPRHDHREGGGHPVTPLACVRVRARESGGCSRLAKSCCIASPTRRTGPGWSTTQAPAMQQCNPRQQPMDHGVTEVDGTHPPPSDVREIDRREGDARRNPEYRCLRRRPSASSSRKQADTNRSGEEPDHSNQPVVRLPAGHRFESSAINYRPQTTNDVVGALDLEDVARRGPTRLLARRIIRVPVEGAVLDDIENEPMGCCVMCVVVADLQAFLAAATNSRARASRAAILAASASLAPGWDSAPTSSRAAASTFSPTRSTSPRLSTGCDANSPSRAASRVFHRWRSASGSAVDTSVHCPTRAGGKPVLSTAADLPGRAP